MNIMDVNIPDEIQGKLIIIEKEMDFSQKMKPPERLFVLAGLLFVISAVLYFFDDKNYILAALFLLLGFIYIAGFFAYKKLYKLHSNARDMINYYRNREIKK